ncbi:ArsO family NAD(P)H-dependent flavin-containing monooxygenase [Jiangella anatolica]|uniref:Pyridine nucleotide-disulfide oxidoreductase n=1 Tax=Jiangella anatolica TaxID=2670374 RepID=A0A2W2D0Q1_9ACTN|nr:ArsO family NAD(P)H-dependent flavin-containing monooxygenase [Jiangella anatolica]PZF86093.1 pyridine nucleotide-disulfide oxidoreductase [Jiangella anatolica]
MTVQLRDADVIVVGGGQAGLVVGYYLRRAGVDFLILDDQPAPGGAWQHAWPSLRLFSPASYSSLAGWMMPPAGDDRFPDAAHVVDYLTRYEKRYDLPVVRPVRVSSVSLVDGGRFEVVTDGGSAKARAVVSATGTWSRPYVPAVPGRDSFRGRQLHAVDYDGPEPFVGQRVAVVGGGNSGAQILAELSTVAETIWITQRPPRFLPDDVDGRVLFQLASRRFAARRDGVEDPGGGIGGLGDIVMVPPVREARDRDALVAEPPVSALTPAGLEWPDGRRDDVDAVVWCTGFKPALGHLDALGVRGRVAMGGAAGTRSTDIPGLYLVGYGDWTGPASATLVGAARTARDTVHELIGFLTS